MTKLLRTGSVLFIAIFISSLAAAAEPEKDEPPAVNAYKEFIEANRLASAGALTRSIPHYRKVIDNAPFQYPLAHFNLAEVLRNRGNCTEATLLYHAYRTLGDDEDIKTAAGEGLQDCRHGQNVGTLDIKITSTKDATIRLNGYILARDGRIENLPILPGTYELHVEAPDHHATTRQLKITADEPKNVELRLIMPTFYGEATITVDQPGAKIRLHPRQLHGENPPMDIIEYTSPINEPLRLVTGTYFLEITLDDYRRWIRNIEVHRDQNVDVDARLRRELPPEIRSNR